MGVEIRTDRLRPPSFADARRIRALGGEFDVARRRVPRPCPDGEAERFVATCRDEGARVWAIELAGEPGLIGTIGIGGPAGRQNLEYWLGVPYRGQEHCSEAARAVVDRGLAEEGVDGFVSGALDGNAASLRVQEKPGFRVTGRRLAPWLSLGQDRLHVDPALPRAHWEART